MTIKYLKTLAHTSLIIVLGFSLASLTAQAATWTGPSATPPGANVDTPINVGSVTQTKAGVLNVSGIRSYVDAVVDGKIGVGTVSPSEKLTVNAGNILISNFNEPKLLLRQSSACTNGDCFSYTASLGMKYDFSHSLSLRGLNGKELLGQYLYDTVLAADGGNVGVGTTVPTARLTVVGPNTGASTAMSLIRGAGGPYWNVNLDNNALGFSYNTAAAGQEKLVIASTGNVGVGVLSPANKLSVGGDVGATAFFYTSDRNLKKNITPLSNALSNISKLEGVSFNWKDTGEKSMGLVAQDVEKVYPELVSTNPETGVKSVQYGNLVAPLIEAIKEQQKQIDALKAEIETLKAAN